MTSTFPFRSDPMFATIHRGGGRTWSEAGAPRGLDSAVTGRTSRADRLVPPDVAARYIESGDRLARFLIGLDAFAKAFLGTFRRSGASSRRGRA
jgi:hypothetical protein